jgi:hypothetical protein
MLDSGNNKYEYLCYTVSSGEEVCTVPIKQGTAFLTRKLLQIYILKHISGTFAVVLNRLLHVWLQKLSKIVYNVFNKNAK